MKAKEVLRRYATGERDFRDTNLCGQNFSGEDLSGANFSYANIRGANFNRAILRGTNFTGAEAGVQQYLITGLLVTASCFSVFSAVVAMGYGSNCDDEGKHLPCSVETWSTNDILMTLMYVSSSIYWTCYFLKGSVKHTVISAAVSTGISIFVAAHALSINLTSISGSGRLTSFFDLMIAVLIPISTVLFAHVLALQLSLLLKVGIFLVNLFPEDSAWKKTTELYFHVYSSSDSVVPLFLGRYSTSFRGSNLIESNFTRADISHTNFGRADLRNITWYQSQHINLANFGSSTLKNPQIQQLLTTLQGADQDFSQLNLSGINLQGANLQGANFRDANLTTTNLQDADLSGANLKQTQLDSADLTGATLTGAYIEDWRITGKTNLQGVRCDYVYMRVPIKDAPEPLRKPDNHNETFDDGEFANFVKPYVDILDLYHRQNFDPRAISIAFENLVQSHPEAELEIVAMEKRGQAGFNLKVRTTPTANKSELSEEYFTNYDRLKKLPSGVRLLLAEKDSRIVSLEKMIQKKLEQPTYKIQGDFMPENSGINISGVAGSSISGVVGGDNSGVAGQNMTGVAGSDISGTVTNTIDQLPDSSEPDKPGIKELLIQLQQAIEETTELSVGEKALLLEQVKVFADAKQTSEPEKRMGLVQKAKLIFEAILKILPDTAKLAETCNKLLPMILKALGLSI